MQTTAYRRWLFRGLILMLLAGILARFLHSRATAGTLTIMPMGDSITAGYFGAANAGGYRLTLQNLLTTAGYTYNFVGRNNDQSGTMAQPWHEGYSGYTINDLATQKADGAMQQFHPDVVLLFAGTNDVRDNGNNSDPTDPNYWPTAANRLDALITQLNTDEPGVKIIVGNLMHFFGVWDYVENRAETFNGALTTVIANHQALKQNVSMVDLHDALPTADLYTDGLHPNADGYGKMADVWLAGIQQAVPLPEPSVLVLLATGLLLLLAWGWWKRKWIAGIPAGSK